MDIIWKFIENLIRLTGCTGAADMIKYGEAKASRNRDSLRNLEAAGTADRNGACRLLLNVMGRGRLLNVMGHGCSPWAIAECNGPQPAARGRLLSGNGGRNVVID